MKKLFTLLAILGFGFAGLTPASASPFQHYTKSGKLDKRYNDSKHVKKDGTMDMRYKTSKKAVKAKTAKKP